MLSVCVPVYRRHGPPNVGTLGAALATALGGEEGELVVALNGIDASSANVPKDARMVDLGVNRGVAPGWNAAAAAARGEILCFANDDCELGPGSLASLAEALMSHPDAGVVGPVGTRWDLVNGRHVSWLDLATCAPGEVAECEVVAGFLFACRREVWEAVDGFDDAYAPFSWEEVDFCTAVRTRLGLRCYAVAGVGVGHAWGVSRSQRPWARARWNGRSESVWSIHRRNRRRFLHKWAGVASPVA